MIILIAAAAVLSIAAFGGQATAISACSAPAVNAPSTLPSALLVGSDSYQSYSYGFPAACGAVSLTSGTPPAGLTVDPNSGAISGDATGPVGTSTLTFQATLNGATSDETVALPVVDDVKVDPSGGELTGAANDGSLAYFSGLTANQVFDMDTANPPAGHGIAIAAGLLGPAAVAAFPALSGQNGPTGQHTLAMANFDAPQSAGVPASIAVAPQSTAVPTPFTAPFFPGSDTSCDRADAITGTTAGNLGTLIAYSCVASSEVRLEGVLADTFPSGTTLPTGCSYDPLYPGFIDCSTSWTLPNNGAPSGIAFDGADDIFIADARNDNVTIEPSNGSAAVIVTLPAGSKPANVAWDADNTTLYVADPGTGAISMVHLASDTMGNVTISDAGEIDLGPGTKPYGVAVDPANHRLVVTESGVDKAAVIDLSTTPATVLSTPTVGSVPDGVTIANGEAFVANEMGGVVSVIASAPPSTTTTTAPTSNAVAEVGTRAAITHDLATTVTRVPNHVKLRAFVRKVKAKLRYNAKHHIRARRTKRTHKSRGHHQTRAVRRGRAAVAVVDPLVAPLRPFGR